MNPLFDRMVARYVPPMNERIMKGLAVSVSKEIEAYLDAQIRVICQGMPPCLRYDSYRRCTSQEMYEEMTRSRTQKRVYNIAESSLYMVNYYFIFKDPVSGVEHEIVKPVYLPIIGEGNIITLSGSKHHIIPVISDKVITPEQNSIFVKVTQDKNKFYRTYHTVIINDKRTAKNVAWATIYRNTKPTGVSAVTKAETVLVHYLFARLGFSGAFVRYGGTRPIVGHYQDITPEKYPETDWVIYRSNRRPPDTCIDRHYKPSNIAIAVPLEQNTPSVTNLAVGLFYIIDHFTDRFEPRERYEDSIDAEGVVTKKKAKVNFEEFAIEVNKRLEDIALWLILIGDIRFGNQLTDKRKYDDIRDHVETLDSYLDTIAQRKLSERGIDVENYFDLLQYISVNYDDMMSEGKRQGLNVYGKAVEILSFLLEDITEALTREKFELNKIHSRRPVTMRDVLASLRRGIRLGAIYSVTKGKIVSKAVNYSGDHMYPATTSVLAQQESRADADREEVETVVVGPQHYLDLSMITVGSILNLPKKTPTPLARVNPWATIDPVNGTILENPKLKPIVDATRPILRVELRQNPNLHKNLDPTLEED